MLKKYMIDKKQDIHGIAVVGREITFPTTKEFITSIIGPRRAGKTYSLFDFIKKNSLKDDQFLFINFEDDDIQSMKRENVKKCVSNHIEIYGKEPEYLFFDEIHEFDNWHSWIYSLYERKRYHIFITGSSSKLLSKEISTELRGRCVTMPVFPFSFREFLSIKKMEAKKIYSTTEESKIKNLLRAYLENGGFPQILLGEINPTIFFRDYVDLVVFKDVVERYGIKEAHIIKQLIKFAAESFSKQFSLHKIFNMMKSMGIKISKKTVYAYAHYLEDAMFLFFLKKFAFSERTSELSIPKVYINDNGIVNHLLSTSISENLGRLMENAVFLELKKDEIYGNLSGIFYWQDTTGEVDFVLKKGLRIKQLIQVSYANGKDEIGKREIKALLRASNMFGCKDLLVITWDYRDVLTANNKQINCIPLWEWLIEKQLSNF